MKPAIDTVRLFGQLDRCLSEMKWMAHNREAFDEADLQTLKHHADDMRLLAVHLEKKLAEPAIKQRAV